MTPADRAAALAAFDRATAPAAARRVLANDLDSDARHCARAVLDLAATVERVEALCEYVEREYGPNFGGIELSEVRAALDGGAT